MVQKDMIKKIHIPFDAEKALASSASNQPQKQQPKKKAALRKYTWLWTVQEDGTEASPPKQTTVPTQQSTSSQ